jgi:hypothetical protein
MKSDLSEVRVGDKIWTIQDGWTKVSETDFDADSVYQIKVKRGVWYTETGTYKIGDKHPSAFLEYPFKEQPIEKDTIVWFRDSEDENWMVGYYSHFEDGKHHCVDYSKKSTETFDNTNWEIVTTENPLS